MHSAIRKTIAAITIVPLFTLRSSQSRPRTRYHGNVWFAWRLVLSARGDRRTAVTRMYLAIQTNAERLHNEVHWYVQQVVFLHSWLSLGAFTVLQVPRRVWAKSNTAVLTLPATHMYYHNLGLVLNCSHRAVFIYWLRSRLHQSLLTIIIHHCIHNRSSLPTTTATTITASKPPFIISLHSAS